MVNLSRWALSVDLSALDTALPLKDVSVFILFSFQAIEADIFCFADTNEREGPLNTHRRVFDYLTSKYPHPGHKFTNGAVAATGTYLLARSGSIS